MLLNYIYGDTLRFEFKQESVRQDLKENDLIPALKKLLTHEEELAEIQRRKELQAEIEKKAFWAENWGLPRLKALVEQSFWVRIEILSVSVKFKHFFAKFLELENSLSNAPKFSPLKKSPHQLSKRSCARLVSTIVFTSPRASRWTRSSSWSKARLLWRTKLCWRHAALTSTVCSLAAWRRHRWKWSNCKIFRTY